MTPPDGINRRFGSPYEHDVGDFDVMLASTRSEKLLGYGDGVISAVIWFGFATAAVLVLNFV